MVHMSPSGCDTGMKGARLDQKSIDLISSSQPFSLPFPFPSSSSSSRGLTVPAVELIVGDTQLTQL